MNYSKIFDEKYTALNDAQRAAVDHIDGPVMIVAGPGTGKTQLLAMRVANILRTADVNPSNVLCLTFTDNAAANMTERMASIFGSEAYRVATHTFHSFGTEIINRYPEYFYNGAVFNAADEIAVSEILNEILSKLPHNNPLSVTMNGEYTYFSDIKNAISDFKNSGLMPNEIRQILEQNLKFCNEILPSLRKVFENRISKNTIPEARNLLSTADKLLENQEDFSFTTNPNLAEVFVKSLSEAIEQAENLEKTTPLTTFKGSWTGIDNQKNFIFKDAKNSEKLLFTVDIYERYMEELQKRSLYDFDDMILRVITAVEKNADLKFELQEQYQYILVDEFQDTNGAQMRLLNNIIDYEAPNIMVVGDDDQAIYRFQGADISNIQSFTKRYASSTIITLTENYRSGAEILSTSEKISSQIAERLTNSINTDKTLNANTSNLAEIKNIIYETQLNENFTVAEKVASEIARGINPEDIAIIARTHANLEQIVPFLIAQKIPINYDREQSILESPSVEQLLLVAQIVNAISNQSFDAANELLPQMLSFPAWGIPPTDVFNLSLSAKRNHRSWLEEMKQFNDSTKELAEWLAEMSVESRNEPLENVLDELLGSQNKLTKLQFTSPLYEHFFGSESLEQNPSEYLEFLSALSTLRQKLRNWRPDKRLLLADLFDFIQIATKFNTKLLSKQPVGNKNAVQLLTAHKSKGLEFNTVFIVNATSQRWGTKSKPPPNKLPRPHNLHFRALGDNDDERLRLLFVAMTRAKQKLIITSSKQSIEQKTLLPLEYLDDQESEVAVPDLNPETQIAQAKISWHTPFTELNQDLKEAIKPRLERYKLSATHLNNFIDVTNGGPERFLMSNLLHFPVAKTAQAHFGTTIHSTLHRAHTHLIAKGESKSLKNLLDDFVEILKTTDLSVRDFDFYQKKGIDILTNFYEKRIKNFNTTQRSEYNFLNENIIMDDVKLTGTIDLINVDKENKTITLTDYKTGKPATGWQGKSGYEKIKLHKYRQQLLFYKLLIENSREFAGYRVEKCMIEFVEPLASGEISILTMNYDEMNDEMPEFKKLVLAVWLRILNLDFPGIDEFEKKLRGVIEFEKSLIDST